MRAKIDYGFLENGPVLSNLQGAILLPHGHAYQHFIFLKFNQHLAPKTLCSSIKDFSINEKIGLSTAEEQIKNHNIQTNIFFSYCGLQKLLPEQINRWTEFNFQSGMKNPFVASKFNDGPLSSWQPNYQQDLDVLISIASPEKNRLEQGLYEINKFFSKTNAAEVLFVERGEQLYKDGFEVEPFGYRDNLSQPILLNKKGEIKKENLPIVFDKYWGTYLVFRKLEQNVDLFDKEVKKLARSLQVSQEYAEAQIMGRFKDGTPLLLFDHPIMKDGKKEEKELVEKFNQFDPRDATSLDYSNDPQGLRCPFHAHIRKANPRKLEEIKDKEYVNYKFRGQILRRSIPYKEGDQQGLLFLCFQRNIRFQFEMIQKFWSTNPDFPKNVGLKSTDPIIGPSFSEERLLNKWNKKWGDATLSKKAFRLAKFVSFKGGEFFYGPSISFFKKL